MDDWRKRVCDEARTWEGTPYVAKARVKGVGVDCGGLLYEVYNPIFGPFPAFPQDYTPDWAYHEGPERYLDFIMPYVIQVPAPVPGGFSVFHYGIHYSHAAILLEDGHYIHAWGRTREGRVTRSSLKVMAGFARLNDSAHFPPKHYDAVVK